MSIITKMLRQQCYYWGPPTRNADGSKNYPSPVTLKCRWEDKSEKFVSQAGTELVSRSVVYVESDVVVDGKVQLKVGATAANLATAITIRQFSKVPNLKTTEFLRIAYL